MYSSSMENSVQVVWRYIALHCHTTSISTINFRCLGYGIVCTCALNGCSNRITHRLRVDTCDRGHVTSVLWWQFLWVCMSQSNWAQTQCHNRFVTVLTSTHVSLLAKQSTDLLIANTASLFTIIQVRLTITNIFILLCLSWNQNIMLI